MRIFKLASVLTVLALCFVGKAFASPICPNTASTNTDCGFILTIGVGGTVTGAAVPGANPYDGSDDALIGAVNNSGAVYSGAIVLTGSGNGGGLFAFDGDGICAYVPAAYCSTAATGYEGPGVTFSNISASETTGTVNILNLAAGGTTFFSLESSPNSISGGGGIGVGGQVPEPSTLAMMGTGLLGAVATLRRRFSR